MELNYAKNKCNRNLSFQYFVIENTMQQLKKFFWFCSGASIEILEQCPQSEHSKYVGIGATVFFTALLASISGAYALYTVFDQIIPALLFGIVWGFCIFNLDRFIVSTLKKEGNFWQEMKQAMPRIVLALLIAIVISKPLELKIFEKEIIQTLDKKKADLAIEQYKLADKKFYEIDSLKNEVAILRQEIAAKAAYRDTLYNHIIAEAEGRSATNKVGKGPVYKEKREQFDKAELELGDFRTQNETKISELQSKIHFLDSLKSVQKADQEQNIAHYDGLMARIDALQQLPPLPSIFILLLFICIETAPVFSKLLAPRGPYDEYLKEKEHDIAATQWEKIAMRSLAMSKRMKVTEYLAGISLEDDMDTKPETSKKVNDAHHTLVNEAVDAWTS